MFVEERLSCTPVRVFEEHGHFEVRGDIIQTSMVEVRFFSSVQCEIGSFVMSLAAAKVCMFLCRTF